MNQYEFGTTAPSREPYESNSYAPSFRVIKGNISRGAHAGNQVSALTVTLIKCAVVLTAILVASCLMRVAFIATTFTYTAQNDQLRKDLTAARLHGNELEIQHSTKSNADRIARNAILYGMVPADELEYFILHDTQASVSTDPSALLAQGTSADIAVE